MRETTSMTKRKALSEEVREAIAASPKSRYRISKEMGGFSQAVLSRFMSGASGLSMSTLDELARVLDLHVVAGNPPRKRRST